MSAQHIPGPWSISTDTVASEVCTIYGVTTQPTEDGLGQGWVYVHHPMVIGQEWYFPTAEEKWASAVLIAAAPEMLAALLVARSTIRRAANTAMTTSGQRDFNAKADMLDATIAKAKGGAA